MLLVAVATLSGTPIATFMTGTLTMPPPTPSSADTTPAPTDANIPNAQPADAVAVARRGVA